MKFRRTIFEHRIHYLVSGLWFFGLLFGLWIAFLSGNCSGRSENVFLTYHASVIGVFVSTFLPLIAVLVGILFRLRWLTCMVIFAEAFLYGFDYYYLTVSGGAFFRSTQMLSQSLTILILINLSLCSDNYFKALRQHLRYILILAILFCLLDLLLTILLRGG